MNEYYELKICGLVRKLKKVKVAPDLVIASFVMLGDTQLIEKCADELFDKMKDIKDLDMLVCPEAKGIPLTHALAVRLGVDYVVARKSVKGYMENPITSEVKSITTNEKQIIVIDEIDAAQICSLIDHAAIHEIFQVFRRNLCFQIRKLVFFLAASLPAVNLIHQAGISPDIPAAGIPVVGIFMGTVVTRNAGHKVERVDFQFRIDLFQFPEVVKRLFTVFNRAVVRPRIDNITVNKGIH